MNALGEMSGGIRLLGPLTGRGGGASQTAYDQFAALFEGETWALYDFGQTDTTYQGVNETPADDATEPIGFVFDISAWEEQTYSNYLSGLPELIENGTFASNVTGWTVGSGPGSVLWHASEEMQVDGSGGTTRVSQSQATTVGDYYRAVGEITVWGSTFTAIRMSGSASIGTPEVVINTGAAGTGALIYEAIATTSYLRAETNNVARFDNMSLKHVPGFHAKQTNATFKPTRQAGGVARFDASNDRLATNFLAGASGNVMAVRMAVPASVTALHTVCGQRLVGNRWFLSVNTSGNLCAGVGTDGTATIVGATDIRGTTGNAILVENGSNVYLYWNGTEEYSGAQSSAPDTTVPVYIGAMNNNGTPEDFCGEDIAFAILAQGALSVAEIGSLNDAMSEKAAA